MKRIMTIFFHDYLDLMPVRPLDKHKDLFEDLAAIAKKHNTNIVFSKEMSERQVEDRLHNIISVMTTPNDKQVEKIVILKMRKPTAN